MKEKQFRLALKAITQRDISDVNLWEDIKAKAVERSSLTLPISLAPVPRFVRANRLVIVLALLSVVSMTGFALYQLRQPRSGLDGIRTSALRTEVNQSQTIDGVTVTLNWVYADTEQLVLSYSSTVLDEAGAWQPIQYKDNDIVYRLLNAEGEWIIPDWSTTFIDRPRREIVTAAEWTMTNPFPQSFTFELVFNERPLPSQKTGGGAVIGGYRIPPESTREPGQLAVPSGGVGPFRFDFNVSLSSGLVLNVNQTAEGQGYSVTLQGVRITPSKALVSFCFQDDIAGEWSPALISLINPTYSSNDIKWAVDESKCIDASVGLYTPELPEQLTFQVEAFDKDDLTPEDWKRIRQRIREKGGHLVFANGRPQSWDHTLDEVKVELGYRVLGQWTITIDVEETLEDSKTL
jgi:hypothetical protein